MIKGFPACSPDMMQKSNRVGNDEGKDWRKLENGTDHL
jgi:hypothetical protein